MTAGFRFIKTVNRDASFCILYSMRQFLSIGVLAFVCVFSAVSAEKTTGYVRARGKPTGAGLFIDGKYVGPAGRFTVPEKYTVEPGEHEVSLRDPRFEDFTTKVSVKAGKTAKLSYKLKPANPAPPPYGRLRLGGGEQESFMSVAAGDTGAVYINDKYYGFVDELNNAGGGLLLPAGTYKLHVSSPLFGEINQDITIVPNKVTIVGLAKK